MGMASASGLGGIEEAPSAQKEADVGGSGEIREHDGDAKV